MVEAATKPFTWITFVGSLVPAGLMTFSFALMLDRMLLEMGVAIHPWHEAAIAGFLGALFSIPAVPILWRLGLKTLPQYMLGGVALFVPSTLLSLFILSNFYSITFEMSQVTGEVSDSQMWALTLYTRIARSGLLVPVHILSFWFVYHKLLGRIPR